jgi:hypothetical protein
MTWYSLEILYDDGRDMGTFRKKNMTGDELMKFRENIFKAGLYIPDPDRPATEAVIIPPWEIRKIYCFMQAKKFE